MKKKFHYAWLVMFACFLMNLCVIGIASLGISLFLPYLRESLNLSATQSSFVLSLQGITTILTLGVAGTLFKKYSVRLINLAFIFVCVIGFVLMAFAQNIFMLYAGALLSGITLGCSGHVPTSTLINRWFIKARGTAFGFVTVGSGVCTLVLSPIITGVIETYSVTAGFLFAAGVMLVLELIAFFIARNKPEDMGLKPYGYEESLKEDANSSKPVGEKQLSGYTHKQALKSPSFWILGIVVFMVGFTVKPAIGHLVAYAQEAGHPAMLAAAAYSLYGGLNIVSKPLYGAIKDKIGTFNSNWYIFLAYGIGLGSALLVPNGTVFLYVFIILFSIGVPIGTMGNPFWVTDLFGLKEYGAIYSNIMVFYNLGITIGSSLFGILCDFTGTYLTGYIVCAVMMFVGLVIVQYAVADGKVSRPDGWRPLLSKT